MKLMAGGGRYFYHIPGVQAVNNLLSTSYSHQVMQRFFAENPTPTDLDAYKGLEIFWNYNFLVCHPLPNNLHIPILVITAGKDPMFTGKMGDELASHLSNSTHLHFANAGHLVMAKWADFINQAIADWLSKGFYN